VEGFCSSAELSWIGLELCSGCILQDGFNLRPDVSRGYSRVSGGWLVNELLVFAQKYFSPTLEAYFYDGSRNAEVKQLATENP
jgi:hypothetical protein